MSETLGNYRKVPRKRVLHDCLESDEQKPSDLFEREIKQETLYCLDAVKDEPLDTPKPEEFIASCQAPNAAEPTRHEVFDGLEQEPNDDVFRNNLNSIENTQKFKNNRCPVCLQIQIRENMKLVTIEDEKLMIMKPPATQLMPYKKHMQIEDVNRYKKYICHDHFIGTVNVICGFLYIETLDEIDSCSDNLMHDLMKIVDYLRPQTKWPFRKSLKYFFTRNKDILKSLVPPQTELEKKKPKSLHEEYIKEEIHDCSEMVKEEPFHERFFCQTMPKLEQFIDPCLPSTSLLTSPVFSTASQIKLKEVKHEDVFEKEIKQESDYMMEKVKEEPFEEDYYNQDSLKDASISNCIPVVQNNYVSESIVDVKLEPIDDVDNDSGSAASNAKVIKTAVTNQSTTKNVPRIYYYQCSICNSYDDPQNMKYTTSEEDQLIIMIGCVLRNECTLEQARLWMSNRKNIFICHSHFTDSIRGIYKNLNVRNPHEVMKCSMKMERNLISVLEVLAPMLKTKDFKIHLNKFYWKNKNII